MMFLTYDEKIILLAQVTLTLIMIYITTYLTLNKRYIYEPMLIGNTYVIKTVENYETDKFKKQKSKYTLSKFNLKISQNNFDPKFWNELVQEIASVYNKYDAFVIICDKNTLLYTASVLSFLLENLSKPVILSVNNLDTALKLALHNKIPEVMVQSKKKLLRGCRILQNSTGDFISPTFPELTIVNSLPLPIEQFKPLFLNPNIIINITKISKGFNSNYLKHLTDTNVNINAVILETNDANTSLNTPDFLKLVNNLVDRGLFILITSQSKFDDDNDNFKLTEAGVLLCGNITITTAYAKLAFLLGNVSEKKFIGQLLEQNFRGEYNKILK